jgi:hypothetical protein
MFVKIAFFVGEGRKKEYGRNEEKKKKNILNNKLLFIKK